MSDGPQEKATNGEVRGTNGQYAKGHCGGPGRPQGSVDIFAAWRRQAKSEGRTLEAVVCGVMKNLLDAADGGDVAAMRLLLDRIGGQQAKPAVEVNVDARTINLEPTVPEGKHLGKYVQKLAEVAEQQGLMDDD